MTRISARRSAAASRSAASSRRDRPCPEPARTVYSVTTSPERVTIVTGSADLGSRERRRRGEGGIEVVGDDDVREDAEHALRRRHDVARRHDARDGAGSSGDASAGLGDRDVDDAEIAVARRRARSRSASSRASTSTPSASGPSAAAIAAS